MYGLGERKKTSSDSCEPGVVRIGQDHVVEYSQNVLDGFGLEVGVKEAVFTDHIRNA